MNKPSDLANVDATLKSMYAAISFSEGGEPNWELVKSVFHPSARLTRITPEGIDYFDLESFQAMAMEMLDRGMYTCFFEVEIGRSVQMFGALAHVLSAYETRANPDAVSYLARGINSIQLLRVGSKWQVHSLLWDEETPSNRLDLTDILKVRPT